MVTKSEARKTKKRQSQEKALASTNGQAGILMPAVTPEEAKKAWKAYQDLKNTVKNKEDSQIINGKEFLKKSYWRKIATFFNLSVEYEEEEREQLSNGEAVYHFICKAISPNGRFAIGAGSCSSYEKAEFKNGRWITYNKKHKKYVTAKPNSIHNVRSTAETRAWNRAVSNLVGGGEVSAEEVNHEELYKTKNTTKTSETNGEMASVSQKNLIKKLLKQTGHDEEKLKRSMKTKIGKTKYNDLTVPEASSVIEFLLKAQKESSENFSDIPEDL